MPEHTPAPTPSRAVYGFVFYLTMKTFFFIYLLWAIIPDNLLTLLNLTYTPQKYWAIAVPVLVLVATFVFAFFIYPGLNLCLVPDIDGMDSITDSAAIFRCKHLESSERCREKLVHYNHFSREDQFCEKHTRVNLNERTHKEINEKFCDCLNTAKCYVGNKPSLKIPVEPVSDLTLSEVNKMLYLRVN